MTVISAVRDFADGLTRGLSLFFTQRNDFTERTLTPGARDIRGQKRRS